MTYTFTVTFQRDLNDDLEVIKEEAASNPAIRKKLVQQFRKELQMVYDDCAMAGVFNIETMTIDGTTYAPITGKKA